MRRNQTKKLIQIGIDEVGRGALAGPVVVAAVLAVGPIRWSHPRLGRIRDSKKLTPKRREEWFGHLVNHPSLEYKICRVGPAVIDRINISRAANLGAWRACRKFPALPFCPGAQSSGLGLAQSKLSLKRFSIVLDGGLRLPGRIKHRTIVKGDEKMPVIAAASIIAKVWRDRYMTRLSGIRPEYGFQIHKGYGTKFHKQQIFRHGPSAVHRRTFLG